MPSTRHSRRAQNPMRFSLRHILKTLWNTIGMVWLFQVIAFAGAAKSKRDNLPAVNQDSLLMPAHSATYSMGTDYLLARVASNPNDDYFAACVTAQTLNLDSPKDVTQVVFLNATDASVVSGPFVYSHNTYTDYVECRIGQHEGTVYMVVRFANGATANLYAQKYQGLQPDGELVQLTNCSRSPAYSENYLTRYAIAVNSQGLSVSWLTRNAHLEGFNTVYDERIETRLFNQALRAKYPAELIIRQPIENFRQSVLHLGSVASNNAGKTMTTFFVKPDQSLRANKYLNVRGDVTDFPSVGDGKNFSITPSIFDSAFPSFDLRTRDENSAASVLIPGASFMQNAGTVYYMNISFNGTVTHRVNITEGIEFGGPHTLMEGANVLVLEADHPPLKKGDVIAAFYEVNGHNPCVVALRDNQIFGTPTKITGEDVYIQMPIGLSETQNCIMLTWRYSEYKENNRTESVIFTCLIPRIAEPVTTSSVDEVSALSTEAGVDVNPGEVVAVVLTAAAAAGLAAYGLHKTNKCRNAQAALLDDDSDEHEELVTDSSGSSSSDGADADVGRPRADSRTQLLGS